MDDQKKQIIEVLSLEKRPISISEIAKKSGMHRSAVARNLDVLEILGKVRKIQKGTAKKYFLVKSLPVSGLIDISSDLIIIINPNLEIQYLNNAALHYFSLSPSQILGEKLSLGTLPLISHQDILHELENYSFEKVIKKLYQSEQGRWFEITILGIYLLFSPNLIGIIATDISDRVAIEEQLKKSERRFRLLVETTRHAISILDPVTLLHTYVSPSVFNILGYTPEEFMQIPFYQVVDPSQSELVKKISASRLADFQSNPNNNKFYTDEFQVIAKNGSRVWLETTYRLIADEDTGEPEIVTVTRDITEKKALELEARKI
jgi:PAS domain S-box-containing protein